MTPQISFKNVHVQFPVRAGRGAAKLVAGGLFGLNDRPGSIRYVPALRGVSFEIKNSERIGVLGRNGAGKSTLLRTMAGVYRPAHGEVSVNGQVQALFDIGTGFEVDRTGRENIFFRGLVMGLKPDEIRGLVDEIVAFADIGAFIDLPLKSYSTGMVVRLAFAVSTYLRGDILLIDEIFGAGDERFQERARKRMDELIGSARILVFTSHNLALVSELCTRGLWINNGVVEADGDVDDVIGAYLGWARTRSAAASGA